MASPERAKPVKAKRCGIGSKSIIAQTGCVARGLVLRAVGGVRLPVALHPEGSVLISVGSSSAISMISFH